MIYETFRARVMRQTKGNPGPDLDELLARADEQSAIVEELRPGLMGPRERVEELRGRVYAPSPSFPTWEQQQKRETAAAELDEALAEKTAVERQFQEAIDILEDLGEQIRAAGAVAGLNFGR